MVNLIGSCAVPGHKSALAFGLLGSGEGVPVVAMLGRVRPFTKWQRVVLISFQFHPYEGHVPATVTYPIRVLEKLGVKDIISEPS